MQMYTEKKQWGENFLPRLLPLLKSCTWDAIKEANGNSIALASCWNTVWVVFPLSPDYSVQTLKKRSILLYLESVLQSHFIKITVIWKAVHQYHIHLILKEIYPRLPTVHSVLAAEAASQRSTTTSYEKPLQIITNCQTWEEKKIDAEGRNMSVMEVVACVCCRDVTTSGKMKSHGNIETMFDSRGLKHCSEKLQSSCRHWCANASSSGSLLVNMAENSSVWLCDGSDEDAEEQLVEDYQPVCRKCRQKALLRLKRLSSDEPPGWTPPAGTKPV